MKKIGFIVPYFGKLPDNFQIWLNSCAKNETVEWLIFTDDHSEFETPPNVTVYYWEYRELVNRFENHFDFQLSLESAYKLTDFKVAYGEIFKEYLVDFDFWGYCDIDLIFGNIRKFITEEILDNFDKILSRGHLTLFRNSEYINTLYKSEISGIKPFKEVFSNPQHFYFDEWGHNGINYIFASSGLKVYDEVVFHDVFSRKYRFYSSQLRNSLKYKNNNIYFWNNGTLYVCYMSPQKEIIREEILYVHFLRRKMEAIYNSDHLQKILMVPNKFMTVAHDPDNKQVSELLGRRLNMDYLKFWKYHAQRQISKWKAK